MQIFLKKEQNLLILYLTTTQYIVIISRRLKIDDSLAQLAEHMTFNHGVRGSIPRWITKKPRII